MIALNEPIDVTLVNSVPAGCRFEWKVKNDWGISDHNLNHISMLSEVPDESASDLGRRWFCKDVCWEEYTNDLVECAKQNGLSI